jgi:cyclin-dependent kinase-like
VILDLHVLWVDLLHFTQITCQLDGKLPELFNIERYRAPELLVGDANYGKSVDVWALGCLLAEIYNGQPLFPGDSDLHTLHYILETLGNSLTNKQKKAFFDNPIFLDIKVKITNPFIDCSCLIFKLILKKIWKKRFQKWMN